MESGYGVTHARPEVLQDAWTAYGFLVFPGVSGFCND